MQSKRKVKRQTWKKHEVERFQTCNRKEEGIQNLGFWMEEKREKESGERNMLSILFWYFEREKGRNKSVHLFPRKRGKGKIVGFPFIAPFLATLFKWLPVGG